MSLKQSNGIYFYSLCLSLISKELLSKKILNPRFRVDNLAISELRVFYKSFVNKKTKYCQYD